MEDLAGGSYGAAKWDFRSRVPFSQTISQLRNGVGRLRNGTRVPRGGFAAAKHPAKLGYGCENWRFHALGISQPFCNCEMEFLCCEMALVCQEVFSQLRNFSQRGVLGCEIYFAAKGHFRSQTLISQRPCKGCEMISQQMAIFAGADFGLRNFAATKIS